MKLQTARIKAKRETLKALQSAEPGTRYQRHLWCEVCGQNQDRWTIHLMKAKQDLKLVIPGANGMPETMACDSCIAKHKLEKSTSIQAMKFDGVGDAIKEFVQNKKQ
ncbi:hypothetical protein ABES02_29090 [Neobacillus pocheonensis]|uniref:hypothetical protein n=1 Tax=Neobacillus pocheonensis TaxID=363869 RepID=UPI003D26813C